MDSSGLTDDSVLSSSGRWLSAVLSNWRGASRAGLHDNVPDRPSAMVAPVGCQLATMALTFWTLKLSLSQKVGCTTTSQTDPPARLHLLGANWPPWHLKWKLSLSQKVACTAEVVTQSGTSVHLGWVARHWRTFVCYLGSKSAGSLSCNPTLVWAKASNQGIVQAAWSCDAISNRPQEPQQFAG